MLDKAVAVLRRGRARAGRLARPGRARPGCPGRPRTGSRSRWRCTGCWRATRRAVACPGPRLAELARSAPDPLLAARRPGAGPAARPQRRERAALPARRATSGYAWRRRSGPAACATTVPVGARLPMTAGSAAQVLAGLDPADDLPPGAEFSARTLAEVRRRGWATRSASARRASHRSRRRCSTTAGEVAAAISVSGPVERLTRRPGPRFAPLVTAAATALSSRLSVVSVAGPYSGVRSDLR